MYDGLIFGITRPVGMWSRPDASAEPDILIGVAERV